MRFIELEVRTALVVHGYDEDNKEVIEEVSDNSFVTKLVSIDRIQSISEEYILVTSSHGRELYWEYNYSMGELKDKLRATGLMVK